MLASSSRAKRVDSIFRKAWSRETAHPSCQEIWTTENPSVGQCACTALIVQEFLGGTISRLEFPDRSIIYHNRVLNQVVDLTWEQHTKERMFYFEQCLPSIQPRTREQLLANPDTNYRYTVLRSRVLRELGAL